MKSIKLLLTLLIITFSAQFVLPIAAYAKTTPIVIPEYAKSDGIEEEITKKGQQASSLALTIGVSVLIVCFIIGAILVGTGFMKSIGITILVASVAGGILMLLAFPAMNLVLS